MNCTFGALKGNSIHGAKREFMAQPIHDNLSCQFIKKWRIALKECYESDYWLGLFKETKMITEMEYADMYDKCSKIRKLLIASINTAKGKQ